MKIKRFNEEMAHRILYFKYKGVMVHIDDSSVDSETAKQMASEVVDEVLKIIPELKSITLNF
jgi:hypothetical protein